VPVNVLISGFFYPDDMAYVENAQDVRILHYPKLNSIPDMGAFLQDAARADLVILALFGSNVDQMFVQRLASPEALRVLNDPFIRKVLWSMDSHIWHEMEARYQFFFDRYYLAHSPYIPRFQGVDCRWLPCCCFQESIDAHLRLLQDPPPPERDVVFPYMTHPHGERNRIALEIQERLARRGLNAHFGFVGMGADYARAIQASRVCLNISLADDLNVRNFEVWGLDRCLLANPTPDHSRIDMDLSGTAFFQRDLSDFDGALDAALQAAAGQVRSAGAVLNRHMVIHRYVEIINAELGTDLRVSAIPAAGEYAAGPAAPAPMAGQAKAAGLERLRRAYSADWQGDVAESVLRVDAMARAGDCQAALAELDSHLADRADDVGLLAMKAAVLTRLGEMELARREYMKAMALAPGLAAAPAGLAALNMLYLGRPEDAGALLQRALTLDPANRRALALLVSSVLLADRA
jgi:tetratricopeptide (TPR) repeat protein